ncbi:heme oxygenase-like protein [Vararia minispora EC-137]|uniref:Heme oxygenase-like protein n=1 Tax=Vararia minispora EC-137 TaxID=1314806 RepID=A0ACB8QWP1_9AGAM|nr:heme oxygenase-like protein [Vararia minispora EC-137]
MKLSEHLISLSSSIHTNRFLVDAGTGELPDARLALWLAQDRLYASHAYPRFIGRLIAAIPFSSTDRTTSREDRFNTQILKTLVFSLDNIVREVGFFDELGSNCSMNVNEWKERKATRDYAAEMTRVSTDDGLFEGLVFLYAMELIYLISWRKVKRSLEERRAGAQSGAVATLVENWTNKEFERFVEDLASLVDGFEVQPNSARWARAERVWYRTVELEEDFWPNVGEEKTMQL